MLRLLARFVRAESPTDSKPAVDRFGQMVASEWRKLGASVKVLRQRRQGDHLHITWPTQTSNGRQILVLGHLDTVYGLGTLRRMPYRVARGRAFGPGTFDIRRVAWSSRSLLLIAGCQRGLAAAAQNRVSLDLRRGDR